MKFLLIVVLLAAAGSLAQGDAVVNAWLKKHGLSEYADELEELGAESREDLDYLEEGDLDFMKKVHKRKMFKKLREEKEAAPPAKKKKSKGKKKKTPYSDLHTEQKKTKQSKKVKPASAYEAQAADEMAEGPNGMFKGKTIKEVFDLLEGMGMGDSVKDLLSQRKTLADAGIDVSTMMWSDFMGRVNEKSPDGATWRSRLVDFYTEHDPTKMSNIDALLAKYKGREHKLMRKLQTKYGVGEPGKEEL